MIFLLLYLCHDHIQQTYSFVLGYIKVLVNWEEHIPQNQHRDISLLESPIGCSYRIPRHFRVDWNLNRYPCVFWSIWIHAKLGINVHYEDPPITLKELTLKKGCQFDPTPIYTKVTRSSYDIRRSAAHYNTQIYQVQVGNRLQKICSTVITWRQITSCWTHTHHISISSSHYLHLI